MLLAPGDLSAVGFRHSGLAISCEQANKGERWGRGAYFPDKIETHKYVFVSVLCVSLAKGVDTVCRELPLRCRWSYYVWCGRGGGLVSEGVNRYVTAPEALCTQEGRRCLSIFFHPHPCYHLFLTLFLGLSKRIRCGERHMTWIAQHEKLHLSRF